MENQHSSPEKFKYQQYFDKLSAPCPPEGFAARETIAFRWVFEDMNDADNFLPQYIKQPQRFAPKKDSEKCSGLGLSFFDSQTHAQARFDKLKRRMLGRVYGLGVNIAHGTIKAGFGVSNLPSKEGHLTFHPFESVELADHFKIIAAL
ncbi:MAG TPA: hypothetical protein ENJ95_04325 [Bacteroidetes bacterium]|nr:hypothetical protein [Bacteroidota bacterium]